MLRLIPTPTLVALWLLSTAGPVPCQEAAPQSVQSRTLSDRCDDCQQDPSEVFIDLRAAARGQSDLIAFRICTTEPLPVALFAGREAWQVATMMIAWYPDVSADRVLILRATRCVSPDHHTLIESWGVPKGAKMPPFDDGVRLNQIHVDDAWNEGVRTRSAFRRRLVTAADQVRTSADSYLVVRGYYWRRPSATMRAGLAWARGELARQGVDRSYVRQMPALNARWAGDAGRRCYPDLYVVHLTGTLAKDALLPSATPN